VSKSRQRRPRGRKPPPRRTRWQVIAQSWRENWPALRFVALFGLGVVLVYWLLRQEAVGRAVVAPFTQSIATCSGGLISLLGTSVRVSQRVISGHDFTISVENNCNAIFEIGFFLAAVVAYPATWRGRLWAFSVGPPLLYAVNLLRVMALFYVGTWRPAMFDEVHLYVAQSLFILVIALLWLAWVRRFGTRPLELARVFA
jgi:exosortase H (IPTLxxWG-CTERM-specific)